MRVIVVTATRLLGEGLAACFLRHGEIALHATVENLTELGRALDTKSVDVALLDVTQGVDLDEVRAIACAHPDVALVALGLLEQRQDVIRCGRAGCSGYV